jgi:biotin synthase
MLKNEIRNDWKLDEAQLIYTMPLLNLVFEAATMHRKYHNPSEVQISSLLSVKTGGCKEDCSYCPQAARYHTDIEVHGMLNPVDVVDKAKQAKAAGANRMCLGAAWREVRDNRDLDKVLEMVRGINELDMEVCCTLGMLTESQAQKLSDAGVYAYNHNIDTSEDFYEDVISTRKFSDRLDTLDNVRKAKMTVCSGGIIGMGESNDDRLKMLITLANLDQQPESVPINTLVPVPGTPLADQGQVEFEDLLRMIATARIMMPKAAVRLSAGRLERSRLEQGFCFMAGANSIFAGDKLLTTPNPEFNADMEMFKFFGLTAMPSIQEKQKAEAQTEVEA